MERPTQSIGMSFLIVTIDAIVDDTASTIDQYGRRREVGIRARRGKGAWPRTNEVWVIDRTLGDWTFAACLDPNPPVVTGSHDDIPALKSLLEALEEAGIILNQTTDERIRAQYPHTHTGDSGGSTGPDSLPNP